MYVIFPADELILMTYGAVTTPRIQPRPTLDCLHAPQIPFGERSYTAANIFCDLNAPPPTYKNAVLPEPKSVFNYDNDVTHSLLSATTEPAPSFTQSLPPTPKRRTSHTSLTASAKRSSVRSTRSKPPTPPPAVRLVQATTKTIATPPISTKTTQPMSHYNEANMRATPPAHPTQQQQQQQQLLQQQQQLPQRPTLERHAAFRGSQVSPLHPSRSFDPAYYEEDSTGAVGYTRESSPSIFLEPPHPNPTETDFGPGWGRPMSPMDIPPEPPTKSPPSKSSRLRPKLHIPLGRLGRQPSDQRESNRLREDLQLHVENPIFNSENLRQRNFDAFFESGEPVYQLQPKSAPTASSSAGSSAPPLGDLPGVYDSSPRGRSSASAGSGSGGGFFARSSREDKSERSRSVEHHDTERDERAASVSGAAGGTGVSQKGDRFLGKIFKWSKRT